VTVGTICLTSVGNSRLGAEILLYIYYYNIHVNNYIIITSNVCAIELALWP